MNEQISYTGTKTLEILQDVVNYNRFLESELLEFIKPENSAFDFGAGIGEFAWRMKNNGILVSCVEPDSEMQELLRNEGFKVYDKVQQGTARIYSLNVLEHIEDDVSILREINQNLAQDGKLFLYVPAFMSLYTDFDKYVGHYRRYTREELEKKLVDAGFEIDRSEYVDSIGFICWFIMGKLPSNKNTINPIMVKIFDRFLFPLSRIADRIFSKKFGKNLLIIASPKK